MIEYPENQLVLVLVTLLLFLVWARTLRLYPVHECDPEAEARAGALLRELLTEEERRQLVRSGFISVPSPGMPARTYRVPARPGWVEVYDSDVLAMKLCVEPIQRLPAADVVLMHKLMIEGNEHGYLKEANIVYLKNHARRRPSYRL